MGMIIFYFVARLSQRPHIRTKEQQLSTHTEQMRRRANAPEWSRRFRIKPIWLIVLQLFLKMVHDLTNLSVSDCLCVALQTNQPHCTVGLWGISTFCECVRAYSIYLLLLFLHNSRLEYDRGEARGASVLSFAAVSTVLCRSSAGFPLNAIRLRLWLFAFFSFLFFKF